MRRYDRNRNGGAEYGMAEALREMLDFRRELSVSLRLFSNLFLDDLINFLYNLRR